MILDHDQQIGKNRKMDEKVNFRSRMFLIFTEPNTAHLGTMSALGISEFSTTFPVLQHQLQKGHTHVGGVSRVVLSKMKLWLLTLALLSGSEAFPGSGFGFLSRVKRSQVDCAAIQTAHGECTSK